MAVEVRGKAIRIAFTWEGKRYRERWPGAPTVENIRQAERVQDRIRREIQDGTFSAQSFRRYFPNAKVGQDELFGRYAERWLRTASVSEATRHEYKKALNRYWLPDLWDAPLPRLLPSDIKGVVASVPFPSAKTKNNALIPLRRVLEAAHWDELTQKNLADFVKGEKHQKSPPDPFTPEERDAILDHFAGHHLGPYFRFMFWSGLRPSEALALQWADVDLRTDYVRVEKAQSKGRSLARTKTGKVRDVRLNSDSRAALQAQKAKSYLAGGHVFVTEEGRPYRTEKAQRVAFTAALKKLGIRHRPAYNCRHTYATVCLMAGMTPIFVAGQLGHSPVMLQTVYSRWMHGARDDLEMAKLSAAPDLAQRTGKPA